MITIKQFMETVNYRISEGSAYMWGSYGPHVYMLDSWNGDQDGHSFSIIFDVITQEVYEVQAHDYTNNRAYRMINPDYNDKYAKESDQRGISKDEAWDEVRYTDLELDEDFIQKSLAIIAGETYDTRVSIPIELPDNELLLLMKAAHEQDITFNQYIVNVLTDAIAHMKPTT